MLPYESPLVRKTEVLGFKVASGFEISQQHPLLLTGLLLFLFRYDIIFFLNKFQINCQFQNSSWPFKYLCYIFMDAKKAKYPTYLHCCTTFCIKLSLIYYYALILWVTYRQCPRGPKECERRLLHKWLQPHTVASIICWRKSCWCLQWWWGRWTWRTRQTQLTFFWNNFKLNYCNFYTFLLKSWSEIYNMKGPKIQLCINTGLHL